MNRLTVTERTFGWAGYRWASQRLHTLVEQEQADHVLLDFSAVERAYPNGIVPLVVLLDQLRKEHGAAFALILPTDDGCRQAMELNNWAAHLVPAGSYPRTTRANALHRFADDSQLNDLINSQIGEVLGRANFAKGVLQSFEWALNEVAGNVLVHSGVDQGWLQVAVHPAAHHMAVVVADGGLGIPATIQAAFPGRVDRDEDAIALALQEGITSKPDFGQGKGLTGTLEIVKKNRGGRLAVHSRAGFVSWADGRLSIRHDFPPFRGSLVDIQLDTHEPIDIETALWGSAPVYPFNESLYGRETPVGVMRFELAKEASGFGNRVTGQRLRTKIENLLAAAPQDVLEIDFSGVDLVASSFADEVFGKLAITMGFVGFGTRLRLVNLNQFCRGIIDDVVRSRIVQSHVGGGSAK
jgi:anti-sigma regulatory factor (Ser/Thr protein kinase)/anti-anti-sigma regulatory factor